MPDFQQWRSRRQCSLALAAAGVASALIALLAALTFGSAHATRLTALAGVGLSALAVAVGVDLRRGRSLLGLCGLGLPAAALGSSLGGLLALLRSGLDYATPATAFISLVFVALALAVAVERTRTRILQERYKQAVFVVWRRAVFSLCTKCLRQRPDCVCPA